MASFSVPLAACFGSGVTTLRSVQKGHTAGHYKSVCSVENAIRLLPSIYLQNILRPLTTNTFQRKFRTLPSPFNGPLSALTTAARPNRAARWPD